MLGQQLRLVKSHSTIGTFKCLVGFMNFLNVSFHLDSIGKSFAPDVTFTISHFVMDLEQMKTNVSFDFFMYTDIVAF